MTPQTPGTSRPSRAHELMRLGRTQLLAIHQLLTPEWGPVARRAAADCWSRERLTDAIITLEREEPDAHVADHV